LYYAIFFFAHSGVDLPKDFGKSNSGVEKNNDDVRKFHLTKSNKWDAPKLVPKRPQITGQHERVRRGYNKSNTEYTGQPKLEKAEENEETVSCPKC
jgi:hypothetical protein